MKHRLAMLIGLCITFIALWSLVTPNTFIRTLSERLDNLGYDLQLRTRVLTQHAKSDFSVGIIDIDDKSLQIEGRWPWPRSKIAQLVNELQKQGAVVVAFDIIFGEKEPNLAEVVLSRLIKTNNQNVELTTALKNLIPQFDEDDIFAKSLATNQAVLATGFLPRIEAENTLPPPLLTLTSQQINQLDIIKQIGYISNIPILQQAAKHAGFINIYPDSDGIVRRAALVLEYKGAVYPSLALQAVLSFLGEDASLITAIYHRAEKLEGIQIGDLAIPTDAKGQALIPFVGKSYTFPYYSATDVLHGNIPQDALLGKVVFVGTSATGLGDLQATSIQSPFPGVEIQATLVNGMLEKNAFSEVPAWTVGATFFLTLLFGLLASCIFPYLGPRTLGFIIVVFPVSLLFINNYIWVQSGLVISLLTPVILVLILALLNIIYGYLFETRKREQLKEMFGQYVPEKHIDEMLRSKTTFALRGEDRDMSVLFADIRSFTTISEGLSAASLVDMLNTFFTPMTEIIFTHRGTIDKYVGDLIMAFWGAPLKDKAHARHAIESAIEMQQKVREMQPLLAERNWPVINIGIGINSGRMSVGDMGSRFRRNYTVLGDSVNLASRVESLTKFYGVDIMVTEFTQAGQHRFIFRKLDRVRVKGKKLGIEIYEVICRASEVTPELTQELEAYHQALDDYFAQHWDAAHEAMSQLNKLFPDKKIYQIYLERIQEFKENSLPADWDGVYLHLSK